MSVSYLVNERQLILSEAILRVLAVLLVA